MVKVYPGITRSEVAAMLGITYWSARYWLDKLASEGKINKKVEWTIKGLVRRVTYYPIGVYYYRTSLANMFYAEEPRVGKNQTPDPIAEFRVTVVSDKPKQYDIADFRRVIIYIGVILAPQTYWIKQSYVITAYEEDELIDIDELKYSVPVYGRLNYCERYAIFFKSRQRVDWWRDEHPEWWKEKPPITPSPREGDYEYDEKFIKKQERRLIDLGILKYRFNNEKGRMEVI